MSNRVKFIIDGENFMILVDNTIVFESDYDELGWSGMEAVEDAVVTVVTALEKNIKKK